MGSSGYSETVSSLRTVLSALHSTLSQGFSLKKNGKATRFPCIYLKLLEYRLLDFFFFFFFVIKVVVVNFVMFVCFDLYVVCTIPVKRKKGNLSLHLTI